MAVCTQLSRWHCHILLVFTRTHRLHAPIMTLLNNAGVTHKIENRQFFPIHIDLLAPRHQTWTLGNQLTYDWRNLCRIWLPIITKSHSFLGLCRVFQPFIPIFERIIASFNSKLQEDQPHVCTELFDEKPDSSGTAQKKLSLLVLMALPRSQEIYAVNTDEWDRQFRYVIHQRYPCRLDKPNG